MKKAILLLSFIGCCFALLSQNKICVDGSAGSSGNGSASSPYKTIQAAVNAASNGDIIQVAKGTYSEAVQITQKKVQLLGGFAGNGNFTSANPQANVTIIAGTSAAPCIRVYIDAPAITGTLKISGFTIRNGQRGIELTDGWPVGVLDNITIENNIIENNGMQNQDHRGGGISIEGKNITIQNNTIRNNKSGRGAAIGRTSDLINFLIADNTIEKNTGYDDHAGGVIVDGTGTVTRNLFDGNVAAKDLGWGWGGAIVVTNYDTTKVITLSHNVYRNNQAPDRGGAVFVDEAAKVLMEHELFYKNTSKESGSAIYVDEDWEHHPSVLNMYNCTVADNACSSGGAALFVQASIANVQNCIFWNNGSDLELLADGQRLAKLTVNYTLTQQGFTGTGNIQSNPLFANAANGDYHVQSANGRFNPATGQFVNDVTNSPAIDAGNPSSDYSKEPSPNGNRVNLGCYGNTAEASKSATGTGNEEITQLLWTAYPNPAKESVTISHLTIGSRVNIFDITGKMVYSSGIINEQTAISTANFANGVYIIQVANDGAVTSQKLIVIK
jgi:Disaggregatase related./Protein of unknown function (DUF1565).